MRYLIIIPARGGSKGVLRKNIKPLCGKPLIYYTIEAARAIFPDNSICISTDDEEIKYIVEETGIQVPFIRPEELATDTAGTYEVLLHALSFYEEKGTLFDAIILLQPTSPLRTATHIKAALKLFSLDIDMLVSVKETKSNPYYVLFEENEKGLLEKSKKGSFTRRQDCPKVWEFNGAIYIINIKSLKKMPIRLFSKIQKFEMDDISSLDIDSELDFKLAELILSRGSKNA